LIVHAKDDWDIPASHSTELFNALLSPLLPPPPDLRLHTPSREELALRIEKRMEIVSKRDVQHVGTVETFRRDEQMVMHIETHWGGHNEVAGYGGVLDIIEEELGL